MFVAVPEVFKLFLSVLHEQSSSSLLVVHFYIIGFEDQLHLTASAIVKRSPALAHHPIHGHVVSWEQPTQFRLTQSFSISMTLHTATMRGKSVLSYVQLSPDLQLSTRSSSRATTIERGMLPTDSLCTCVWGRSRFTLTKSIIHTKKGDHKYTVAALLALVS